MGGIANVPRGGTKPVPNAKMYPMDGEVAAVSVQLETLQATFSEGGHVLLDAVPEETALQQREGHSIPAVPGEALVGHGV